MVPHASWPAASVRSPASCDSSQRSLVAEKYGSSTNPVRSPIHGSSAWRSRQKSAVRRSCQTIAEATGRPPARSHSTTVSRWFVRPIAVSRRASTPAWASACGTTSRTDAQISSASCSTQPGRG